MDSTALISTVATAAAVVLPPVGYMAKLVFKHEQLLEDQTKRLDRIESGIDRLIVHMLEEKK